MQKKKEANDDINVEGIKYKIKAMPQETLDPDKEEHPLYQEYFNLCYQQLPLFKSTKIWEILNLYLGFSSLKYKEKLSKKYRGKGQSLKDIGQDIKKFTKDPNEGKSKMGKLLGTGILKMFQKDKPAL